MAFIISIVVIIIDQISKHLIEYYLLNYGDTSVIQNILSFVLVYNKGAAFGFLNSSPLTILFFSIIASLVIIYILYHKRNLSYNLSLIWGLILGGAIGNLIDRMFLGHVIDFIKLDFIDFPVFNIADVCINIGIIALLILTILGKDNLIDD